MRTRLWTCWRCVCSGNRSLMFVNIPLNGSSKCRGCLHKFFLKSFESPSVTWLWQRANPSFSGPGRPTLHGPSHQQPCLPPVSILQSPSWATMLLWRAKGSCVPQAHHCAKFLWLWVIISATYSGVCVFTRNDVLSVIGWIVSSSDSYVEVLTPSTSECDYLEIGS